MKSAVSGLWSEKLLQVAEVKGHPQGGQTGAPFGLKQSSLSFLILFLPVWSVLELSFKTYGDSLIPALGHFHGFMRFTYFLNLDLLLTFWLVSTKAGNLFMSARRELPCFWGAGAAVELRRGPVSLRYTTTLLGGNKHPDYWKNAEICWQFWVKVSQ